MTDYYEERTRDVLEKIAVALELQVLISERTHRKAVFGDKAMMGTDRMLERINEGIMARTEKVLGEQEDE